MRRALKMLNKKQLLATALVLGLLSGQAFGTADTLRVIRSGVQTKTSSPIVTDLTVEGTLTGPSDYLTASNLTISKATPVITASASTDTAASLVANAGASSDASVVFKDNGTARWSLGNDASASDAFSVSVGGTLGSSEKLKIGSDGTTTVTGATTFSSTATVTGATTLSSTLGVGGATTMTGALTVNNDTTTTGSVTVGKALIHKVITLAAGATAIDAATGDVFVTQANSGSTAIVSISNPTAGQIITLVGGSSTNASTVADSGNFKLTGAFTANANDTLTLLIVDATTFVEIGRADN